jgi:hypothetical protein
MVRDNASPRAAATSLTSNAFNSHADTARRMLAACPAHSDKNPGGFAIATAGRNGPVSAF